MGKNSKLKIVIQTSAISWQGKLDRSMEIVDGKPVIYWLLKKVFFNWPENKVALTAPKRDRIGDLKKIIREFKNPNLEVVWGPSGNVLRRFLMATKDLKDEDYFLRVLGVNYFFDPEISKILFTHVTKDLCDWAKPPDDFESHLATEVIRAASLRKLEFIAKKKQSSDKAIIQASPVNFITNNSNIFHGHIIEQLPKISRKSKLAMRKKAKELFKVERSEIDQKHSIPAGEQLLFHYELSLGLIKNNYKVLDIACGEGFGSKLIAKKANLVVGADLDKKVVEYAQKTNSAKNIVYINCDANNTPFASNSFDCILSMETLEHVNPNMFLKEMKRILTINGRIVISTPQNRDGQIPINPFHKREYSLSEVKVLIKSYFNIQAIIGLKSGRVIAQENSLGTNTVIIAKK